MARRSVAIERLFGIGEPTATLRPLLIALRIAVTFILVTVGWLFFRLTNFGDIVFLFDEMLKHKRNLPTTDATITSIYLLSAVVLLFHLPFERLPIRERLEGMAARAKPYALGALAAVVPHGPGKPQCVYLFPVLILRRC